MIQFSVRVQDQDKDFSRAIAQLRDMLSPNPARRILFHVYSTVFEEETVSSLIRALGAAFAGAQTVCCTVAGGVLDHDYQSGIVVSAVVFEREGSRAEVRSYDLRESGDGEVAGEIVRFARENAWVKAVEVYRTVHDMNTSDLCETLGGLPQEIVLFGGMVSADYIGGRLSYIADGAAKLTNRGIIAVYYGGDELHVKACRMSGWKPIDKFFTVTKAQKNVVKEIDGAPASDIYKRYLDIPPDEHFVMNVLEFPMLSEDQGHRVVRNVFSLDEDGGLAVAYDVNPGTKLRICYADAASVVEDIRAVSRELMAFTPDVISVVSCITRSIIWRMKEYMPELHGFKSVAPCHGYLSHGELIREDGALNHHNTILVAAAFREGEVKDAAYPELPESGGTAIPLAVRLSTFIGRVTDELRDMYSEVEQAATTDALTQIGNRYLFDAAVRAASADAANAKTKYLLMFDLNGLKFVNDTYGHNEGDALIRSAAEAISLAFSPHGQCFRIGGDEFAVIADFESEAALQAVLSRFHDGLQAHNKTARYMLSMAAGYATLLSAQGKPLSASDWMMAADVNMYLDKTKFHAIKPALLERDMSDFITCVMSLIDNKNPGMAYHAVRVQRMAVMIAGLLGLSEETSDRVSLAAYLHDIGRIGIPDAILTETRALTDEERLLLRQKPVIGRRLLGTCQETKPLADIVYAVDERWDGGGFPGSLSGEEIPLEARVIAVADFIDTALHDGCGAAAVSADECLRRLRAGSATAFDPAVAEAAIENFVAIVKGDMEM